jgi:hypothetical protein
MTQESRMPEDKATPEELLLDLHLERLSDENRASLEAKLRRDPQLRAKSDQLGNILRPLDHWAVAPASPNLANNILRAIRHQESTQTSTVIPITENERYRPAPFMSIRQLAMIAACIAALVSVAVPALSEVRASSNRTRCASNLGSIFRGVT